MSFHTVEGAQAGPSALGILVPPGRRTLVLLRPRALACDLVPLGGSANGFGPRFQEVGRHEAETLARRLYEVLTDEVGSVRVEVILSPAKNGHWVQARVGEVALLACQRVPGQPYQALVFATVPEAERAAADLAAVLRPGAGQSQELYLNTRDFGR